MAHAISPPIHGLYTASWTKRNFFHDGEDVALILRISSSSTEHLRQRRKLQWEKKLITFDISTQWCFGSC